MVDYLRRMSTLKFNERPDYDFFANCFERMEYAGDTAAFRMAFRAKSKEEAIAKEV